MLRRVDALGAVGVLMLLAGAATVLGGEGVLPLWIRWLFGPLMWYVGFAVLLSWLLVRLLGTQPQPQTQAEAEPERARRARMLQRSNFHEHDYDYETPMEPRMRKVPVFGTLLLLFLISVLMISARAADTGASLFASKCAMCHGADGAGKTAMGAKLNIANLAAPEVQKQSDAELTTVITKGKNKMPAYDGKLTKDQIAQVVAHVRDLGKKH